MIRVIQNKKAKSINKNALPLKKKQTASIQHANADGALLTVT